MLGGGVILRHGQIYFKNRIFHTELGGVISHLGWGGYPLGVGGGG